MTLSESIKQILFGLAAVALVMCLNTLVGAPFAFVWQWLTGAPVAPMGVAVLTVTLLEISLALATALQKVK